MIPPDRRSWKLGDLAAELGAELAGDPGVRVDGAAELDTASASDLAALYDSRFVERASDSQARAIVTRSDLAGALSERNLILTPQPKATFARALRLLYPPQTPEAGIDASARVAPTARIHETASVGPYVTIASGCTVGARCVIGAGAVLLEQVRVGDGAHVHPRVVLYPRTEVGPRCVIYAGAVIGAPGFGHAHDEKGQAVRVPHLGRVVLEEEVEIGANTTVDRATFGETRIGARTRLDNLVQIGHNARVGSDSMIAAQSGLSGSSKLGSRTVVGGQSGLADHIKVGDDAAVAAKTAVFQDVESGGRVAGIPAQPLSRWRRMAAVQAKLPQIWASLKRLEKTSRGDDS